MIGAFFAALIGIVTAIFSIFGIDNGVTLDDLVDDYVPDDYSHWGY